MNSRKSGWHMVLTGPHGFILDIFNNIWVKIENFGFSDFSRREEPIIYKNLA